MNKLAELIVKKTNEFTRFNDEWIEYDGKVARVTGWVREEWDYDPGDYDTPPSADFVYRVADLDGVFIDEYELTNEELNELEKLIENVRI